MKNVELHITKDKTYEVHFNHPLINGRRFINNLETTDGDIAECHVKKLRELIKNEEYHSLNQADKVMKEYNKLIASIFYMPIFEKDVDIIRKRPNDFFNSRFKEGAIHAIKLLVLDMVLLSGSIDVDVDEQGTLIIKTSSLTLKQLHMWEDFIKGNAIRLGNTNHILYRSVSELFEIEYNRVKEHAIGVRYIEGKKECSYEKDTVSEDKNTLVIKYRPSHKIFDYNNIEREDIQFINFIKGDTK